jgi:hypothetical protein
MLQNYLFTWRQKHVYLARDTPTAVEFPLYTTKPGWTAIRLVSLFSTSLPGSLETQKYRSCVPRGPKSRMAAGENQQQFTKQAVIVLVGACT